MICRISSEFLVASAGLVLPEMLPPARSVMRACLGLAVSSAILVAMLPLASVLPCSLVPTFCHVIVTALIVIVGPSPNAREVGYVAGLLGLLLTSPVL